MRALESPKVKARLLGLLQLVLGSAVFVGVIAWGRSADVDEWVVYVTPGVVFPMDFLFLGIAIVGGMFALIGLAQIIAPGWLRKGRG